MTWVVMYSGGIGSWATAKRLIDSDGIDNVKLLFTDTMMEDKDLYRFLVETFAAFAGRHHDPDAQELLRVVREGLPLIEDDRLEERKEVLRYVRERSEELFPFVVWLDGYKEMTPWEVFHDQKYYGSLYDPCSKQIKRLRCDRWIRDNCDPETTKVAVGIDWTELHRIERLAKIKEEDGWVYEAPMTEPPYLTKTDMILQLEAEGIDRPRLYEMGFSHNNCGGFCIKAGKSHFATLWREMPVRYRWHEEQEQKVIAYLEKRYRDKGKEPPPIYSLYEQVNGERVPLTLKEYRERLEEGYQPDLFDIGGCGCMIDVPDEELRSN